MSKVSYYTEEGLKKLREELNKLKDIERPKASQAIAEARDKGDLSENAEYDAAKEAQGMLEMQIAKLENTLANADSGAYNTALGYNAGADVTSGGNTTCIGYQAQPSSPTAENEITLGNPDVTVVRMGNGTPLTTTTYVNEEISKKDKLINKLTERLDALELKFKALK